VLGWSDESTLANGAAADLVIGQPGFTTGACNNGTIGAGTLCVPMGIAVDSAGNLYVADRGNSRILVYNSPFTTDTIADMVIGQTDFTSGGCSNPNTQFASASSLCVPTGVTVDSAGNMYVTDMANNRVLEYNAPLSTGMAAVLVVGQANFTSKAAGTGAAKLNQPYAVAVDGDGNMYVADYTNNRVLEYNAPLSNGMSANRVFGQPNMTSNVANPGGISANTLWNPWGVALDAAGNLYVADHSNHRMLEYDTPITTNTTADRVFGQPSLTSSGCNKGGLGRGSLCLPSGPAVDSLGDVWVADFGNNRVLEYGH
jgi:sugar lactone lactonase YvrE